MLRRFVQQQMLLRTQSRAAMLTSRYSGALGTRMPRRMGSTEAPPKAQVKLEPSREKAAQRLKEFERAYYGEFTPPHISEPHRIAAYLFGVVFWLWIFYRAKQDLPVILGYRHAWEHAH
jgi:hypothetical protein